MTRPAAPHALILLSLTCLNVACSSWSPVTLPAPADTTWSIHHRLRVTDSTGTTTVGLVAVVRDSTLVVTGLDWQDHLFALGQVTRIEREHTNVLGTVLLAWITAGTVVAILFPPDFGPNLGSGY